MMADLERFIYEKMQHGADRGFAPTFMPEFMFDFQAYLTEFALRKGRAAIFSDCGTGKTLMELAWAQNVIEHTNMPVFILTPLAVSGQTLEEAERFGIEAYRAHPGEAHKPAVYVTNYEQLHKFIPDQWAGVICDESSILKNAKGVTSDTVTEFMRTVPYRLLATATPAPNDWTELGTSSEALGWLGYQDMISKFFTNKNNSAALMHGRYNRDKWLLRAHAAEGPFWQWLASWSRAMRMPSDLGFDDAGFVLPELIENNVEVKLSRKPEGMLWELPAVTFHEERAARRRSLTDRCEKVAELMFGHDIGVAWCNLNDEGDLLEQLMPGAVQISGNDSVERKEEVAHWFRHSSDARRILITKPQIFGFGLNWQHCDYMTWFPTHSFEQYYQSRARFYRFGQQKPVVVDRIYSNGGSLVLANMDRKAEAAEQMYRLLVEHMNQALEIKDTYQPLDAVTIPAWLKGA